MPFIENTMPVWMNEAHKKVPHTQQHLARVKNHILVVFSWSGRAGCDSRSQTKSYIAGSAN